ncbi:acetate--CoA ligase [Fodinibius sediminis]|uniref:acetate--CoA ligase n=1 Tax=Fodinibius sediminis TaxID=1214077 RepID=A0A521BE23_9BACT|nr:acetate--CoA ligase [Fodinibius sediminis]SMO45355.1 acetyl-CoA synthetase [Fodinibius sediminis]
MRKREGSINTIQAVTPNLRDYEEMAATFQWKQVQHELSGLPGGKGLNIAYEAVDRHAGSALRDKLALRWLGTDGTVQDFTYENLSEESSRFANILDHLGTPRGAVVCTLLGRIPELYVAALGTLKYGAIYSPLFSIYGPDPIYQRLSRGKASVLITTQELFDKKVKGLLNLLPDLDHVLVVDMDSDRNEVIRSYPQLLNKAGTAFQIASTGPEDRALLHFTSGTTGMPKGVVHVHKAAEMHYITGKYVLDFHPEDIFWCTADPGWVTGTSYGILSPLMHGITNLVVEAEFDARLWYKTLEEQQVTVWYTAPTAIRRLMRMSIDVRSEYDLHALRLIHSVGEPLNPEAVRWAQKTLGLPILDNWWQTETGGIMIANYPAMPVKPGSMGRPLPGVEAAVVDVDDSNSSVSFVETPGKSGQLALKKGWPSMFRGYLGEEARYRKSFIGDWYLTGDLASRDEDGYFWFVGRADDIIKTAGHMVGPFEVESALMEHPAVAEAAVIGKPDHIMGEIVKAYIILKDNSSASDDLELQIKGFARKQLGPAVAPKEIEFIDELPKTRSGKIMRRLLRDQEEKKINRHPE